MSLVESQSRSIYRQGDILLVPCSGIPGEALPQVPQNGRIVVAEGERTGHAHTMFADRVAFFREDGTGSGGYLRVSGSNPVALSHEEHAALEIAPGSYRVVQQREYQPQSGPRRVRD